MRPGQGDRPTEGGKGRHLFAAFLCLLFYVGANR
ncbi:DUF6126 family protein [Streptomyces sp. NPDC060064]